MATKKKTENKPAEWMYEIVRRPIVTEKSAIGAQHNQITLEVSLAATKPEIRAAVETLFGVKVTAVNTLRQKGKTKFFRGRKAIRGDMKKAIVSLAEGQAIDFGQAK
ncbi:MAG: 50S ribosomal protein L23 [Rhodospirillales bacterium]|nr:50S ribosomal protein L23 [Alphaproteobacteria bacterium]MCB9986486.1 50S ribosomal protein L23 [Rhodospirillales bacterium]USO06969.1 MAG: 50S ribosomal protein L23 [Rhodospirillales bacterium]